MAVEIHRAWWLTMFFSLSIVGCTGSPPGISGPKWDSAAATAAAFSANDANGDHKLSKEELSKSPGLLAAMKYFDKDGDGSLSEDELKAGLEELQSSASSVSRVTCVVMRGGQPVEGATVKFVPETCMGDGIKSASAVTGRDGTAYPTIPEEDLPAQYRGRLQGVPSGIFRVEVTHPSIAVPPKFNTETTIGRMVTRRDRDPVTIDL